MIRLWIQNRNEKLKIWLRIQGKKPLMMSYIHPYLWGFGVVPRELLVLEPEEDDDIGGVDDVEAVLVDGHEHVAVSVLEKWYFIESIHNVAIMYSLGRQLE